MQKLWRVGDTPAGLHKQENWGHFHGTSSVMLTSSTHWDEESTAPAFSTCSLEHADSSSCNGSLLTQLAPWPAPSALPRTWGSAATIICPCTLPCVTMDKAARFSRTLHLLHTSVCRRWCVYSNQSALLGQATLVRRPRRGKQAQDAAIHWLSSGSRNSKSIRRLRAHDEWRQPD